MELYQKITDSWASIAFFLRKYIFRKPCRCVSVSHIYECGIVYLFKKSPADLVKFFWFFFFISIQQYPWLLLNNFLFSLKLYIWLSTIFFLDINSNIRCILYACIPLVNIYFFEIFSFLTSPLILFGKKTWRTLLITKPSQKTKRNRSKNWAKVNNSFLMRLCLVGLDSFVVKQTQFVKIETTAWTKR